MKNYNKYLNIFLGLILIITACKKDDIEIVDVSFTADKTTINAGETVNFTIGSGANASAIYTGDLNRDFTKSRVNLIELLGLTEQQLRNNIFAERIPGLKEYRLYAPNLTSVPADYSFTGGEIELYNGKLFPWDYSNVTNSRYLKMNLTNGPKILTIKTQKAVVPAMLNYGSAQLSNLNAVITAPNNNLNLVMSFPDGFTPTDVTGKVVRFGFQVVIDGLVGDVFYQSVNVRELIFTYGNLNLAVGGGLIARWRNKFPTGDISKGIDEIRFIMNADDPSTAADDGDLLDYTGNVYIQEVLIGDAANMVKSFDRGVSIPYVYNGTTSNYSYTYRTPGIYKATLVNTFFGRKQYSGDGYQSGRADEISASEYPHKRTTKFITIEVK